MDIYRHKRQHILGKLVPLPHILAKVVPSCILQLDLVNEVANFDFVLHLMKLQSMTLSKVSLLSKPKMAL